MVLKLIDATQAKPGTTIIYEGESCAIRSNEISKTGKHGHAKCRIEAIGLTDNKKRVIMVPGHERFEVPLINKKRGQVLSVNNNIANVMDLESFETLDILIAEEIRQEIQPESQVEYWEIEGKNIIKRKL